MEENLEGGVCIVCGMASTLICARCYDTYCSARCQVLDWPKHRIMCFPMPSLVDRNVIVQKSNSAKLPEAKSHRIANSAASLHKEQLKKPKKTGVILQLTDEHTQAKLPISMNQQLEIPRKPHFLVKNNESSETETAPTEKMSEKTDEPIVIESKEVTSPKELSGESIPKTSTNQCKNIRSMLMKAKLSSTSDTKENESPNKVVAKEEPWMKYVALPEKSEVTEVIVTNFTSNNTGYVILGKDYDSCIGLLESLQKSSLTKKATLNAEDIKVGELYSVQNTDTIYYRGSVVAEQGKKGFRVKLIDFGDEILLEANKFRSIPESLINQPAYAIPVAFKNNKKRLKVEQKLNVRFIELNEECNTIEIIQNSKQMGLITWFMEKEITKFNATLRYILDEKVMTISVQLPEKYGQIFDVLNKELQESIADFESTQTVKPGMMIAIKRPDQQYARGIVTSIDYKANVCLTYLCDYGTFESVIPIPEQVKICSPKILQIPSKTMIMKVNEVVMKDKEKFKQEFYKRDASYCLNFTTEDKTTVEVLLDGTVFATAQLFDTIPKCTDLGLDFWYIQSPSQTYVTLLRTAVDTKIRAKICPVDKHEIFNAPIQAVASELSPLNKAPGIGDIVVHASTNRVMRSIVQKSISKDIFEICDLDSGNSYQCEWKKLEAASKFLQSLPVYTMTIVLSDCDGFEKYDIEEVTNFLNQSTVKNREYILSYEKSIGCDAKLIINLKTGESLGTMLKAHMEKILTEKLAAEEAKRLELEAKRKAEETQRKAKEEKARQEEMALRKTQAEAIQKTQNSMVKILLDDIPTIPMTVGKVSRLIILEIEKQKELVAVCEDTSDNVAFLSDILTLCDDHMKSPEGKLSVGYSPTTNEMCMALFEDGAWYRAVCLDQEKAKFTTLLVDFGTIMETTSDKLGKFPATLKAQPIRTHFATGLSEKMLAKLEPFSKHKFLVESVEDGVYTIKSI